MLMRKLHDKQRITYFLEQVSILYPESVFSAEYCFVL